MRIDDAGTNPYGWTPPYGAEKHLVTEYRYDFKGRLAQTTGPLISGFDENGGFVHVRSVTTNVYDDVDNRILTARGTLVGNQTRYFDSVFIEISDENGRVTETIEACRTSENVDLEPDESFPRSSYTSWKTYHYEKGKIAAVRQYHEIPDEGEGSPDIHYTETRYRYDSLYRPVETISASGVITKTVYDRLDNPVETWIGTSPVTMRLVGETTYDGEGSCATCSGAKVVTQHVDATTVRTLEYGYDWRGRLTHTHYDADTSGNTIDEVLTYDNLDRIVKSERFLVGLNNERLISRTEILYGLHGRKRFTIRTPVSSPRRSIPSVESIKWNMTPSVDS